MGIAKSAEQQQRTYIIHMILSLIVTVLIVFRLPRTMVTFLHVSTSRRWQVLE